MVGLSFLTSRINHERCKDEDEGEEAEDKRSGQIAFTENIATGLTPLFIEDINIELRRCGCISKNSSKGQEKP